MAALNEPANLDLFAQSAASRAAPGPLSGEVLARVEEGFISSAEERLGVPTFFWAARRDGERSFRDLGLSAEQAARRYLLQYAALYRQRPAALAEAKLNQLHDTGKGAIIVSFRKEVDGVRVFRDELKVIMDRQLNLVALSGYLAPFEKAGVRGEELGFDLSAETAVGVAMFDLTGAPWESGEFVEVDKRVHGYRHFALREPLRKSVSFSQPARAREVLFTMPEGLVPGWYVELDASALDADGRQATRMYSYVVSAHDGQLLFRKNLTADAAYSYNVWADANGLPWDGPHGTSFSPHPAGTPNSLQPTWAAQQLITVDHGPISTNDPWLPASSTETVGNNVDAYADLSSPDGFTSGDHRAQVTSSLTFNWQYDSALAPNGNLSQRSTAVAQLFVNNNFFHDWYYDAGFNEAAGNAQQDNLGRGGLGNDVLRAEAQDFSGTDNANMSTPADGSKPRMQMYIFSGASTEYVKNATSGTQYGVGAATFGPQSFDVTANAVLVNDGVTPNTDACSTISATLAGKIAVIDRGSCTFAVKVKNAQNAGAVGAIIVNNQSGGPPPLYGEDATVVIPALSVSSSTGTTFKNAMLNGTLSLQLYRQAQLGRDGTLDNAIVAHEWGHYISNRLIGDANGLNNTQGVGMGEGWGDFHALLMVVRSEDALVTGNTNWEGVYGLSTFVSPLIDPNGLYYGIRRVPYSIDFAKNALTFKHISNGVALPKTHPVAFGGDGANNAEVHNTGEVWATMLWEAYAALLKDNTRLTFQQAQDRMRQYLVAGYKGTPNSPTFLEARDAILAAAWANDPADFQLMWAAFARRGAGQKAVAPSRWSQDNTPVTEDFGAGNQLFFVRAELTDDVLSCDNDGVLDNGEIGTLTVTLRNSGTASLSQTTGVATSAMQGLTFANNGALVFGASQPFGLTVAKVQVTLLGASGIASMPVQVSYDDPALDGPAPTPVALTYRGNVEEVAANSTTDTVEAAQTLWTVGFNNQLDSTRLFNRFEAENGNHVWFGPNPEAPADVYLESPALTVAQQGDLVLTFKHRYDFESDPQTLYDGAVLELQVDGGAWTDVGSNASPSYDGTLAPSPSSNPLRGRMAWAGKSANYPAMVPVTVNLGTQYAGKSIKVRFRIGADDAAAHKGWELDDLGFAGIVGTPFTAVVGQSAVCGNHAPVAETTPSLEVNEGQEVTLTGTATDEDGDALTLSWTQMEGPSVALIPLDGGAVKFTAPSVTADTQVILALTAHDGKESSAAALVAVLVKNVNTAPVARLKLVGGQKPGELASLDASSSSDPDGDALTFRFEQLGGETVALQGAGSGMSFSIPNADTLLRFQVIANDGQTDSAPAVVELTVAATQQTAEPTGCGCSANAGLGALPLWMLAFAAAALFGRRRRA